MTENASPSNNAGSTGTAAPKPGADGSKPSTVPTTPPQPAASAAAAAKPAQAAPPRPATPTAPPLPPRDATPQTTSEQARGGPAKALTLLGLALLAAGFVWLGVQNQELTARLDATARETAEHGAQLRAIQQRLAALEQRPTADLRPLEGRISALEQRPTGTAGGPPVDLRPLEGRLSSLEQRPAAAADPRVDTLTRRMERLSRLPAALATLTAQESALKAEFPAVARAAELVSEQDTSNLPLAERMWVRVRSLVTVRAGDDVLSGPPAAAKLARAQTSLAAGDIAAALAALDGLDPAAAQATAAWRARAKALVDQRAALAGAGE